MSAFNTIHIFGFGDVQIIGRENKGAIKAEELTNLTAFIDHIKSFKPEEVTLTDYHVIHIFNGAEVRYLGKQSEVRTDVTDFTVGMSSIDSTILDSLVNEIIEMVSPAN